MARTPKEVTDAELAVLQVLWEASPRTVREITALLYPGGGNSEVATVQKLCERLLRKQYVERDRSVRPATFAAAVDRDDLIGRHLKGVADKLCAGSFTPLLSHLVEAAGLAPDEIRRLREQVAWLDGQPDAQPDAQPDTQPDSQPDTQPDSRRGSRQDGRRGVRRRDPARKEDES